MFFPLSVVYEYIHLDSIKPSLVKEFGVGRGRNAEEMGGGKGKERRVSEGEERRKEMQKEAGSLLSLPTTESWV